MAMRRSSRSTEPEFSDLEIRIFARQPDGYPVEVTLGGQQEFKPGLMAASITQPETIATLDGKGLFDRLFEDKDLHSAWDKTLGAAPKRRVRLRIDPTAAELHALPWETLCEDTKTGMLSAAAQTPFSRYLPVALPWGGPVEERPIRILAVISNPTNLEEKYELKPVEVTREQAVLEAGMAEFGRDVQVDFLTQGVTLEALEDRLRGGKGYHVLHFVGHGMFNTGRSQAALLLQAPDATARVVKDDDLVGMLARLPVRPLLVFLVACESAKRDTTDAFRGLGPRLVEVGVPAVIAMQNLVSIDTARKLETTFYTRLAEHGQVDCALNEARATLVTTGRSDAAVPVLFMRLKSGQLWSEETDARGAVLGEKPRIFWQDLTELLDEGKVVPILGPRAHGQWLPTQWEIAQHWANRYSYPFQSSQELARVAQYLETSSIRGGGTRARYVKALIDGFAGRLPADLRPDPLPETIGELASASGWAKLLDGYPNDVHRVLASFDKLDLFLTTNPDPLLTNALEAAGRSPQREFCRWKPELDGKAARLPEGYLPARASPLVYHLFGVDDLPESLVLTEDDYFRYLTELSAYKFRIPEILWGKISTRALMFIGYSLYDWEFRVLLHNLVARNDERNEYRHIAVQLEFEDSGGADQEAIQEFLEDYLRDARINVYWGSSAQFVAELREVWEAERV